MPSEDTTGFGSTRKAKSEHTKDKRCDLGVLGFASLRVNSFRENIKALESVQLKSASGYQGQYLDLGCGPADFLDEELLPRLRPCKRVVAVDTSTEMLDYAMAHHQHPDVCYELLDIEHGDPQFIVDEYGLFDHVYAFLTLHFVFDLKKAYDNIYCLLKEGGECLSVNFARTGITDAWHQVYKMETWADLIPDPSDVLSRRFRFNEPVIRKVVEGEERSAAEAAGLEWVSFNTYPSKWTFPTVDSWMDNYVPMFKMDAGVPEEKRPAFRDVLRAALLQRLTPTSSGVGLTFNVTVAHLRKPGIASGGSGV